MTQDMSLPLRIVYFLVHSFPLRQILEGHKYQNNFHSPLPYTYIDPEDLPDRFTWGNYDGNGTSLLTHSLNQHIPQVRLLLVYACLYV